MVDKGQVYKSLMNNYSSRSRFEYIGYIHIYYNQTKYQK